jgi:hypothetical protein
VTRVRIPPALDADELDEEEGKKAKALTRAEVALLLAEIDQREQETDGDEMPDDTKPADWVGFFEFLTGGSSPSSGIRKHPLPAAGEEPSSGFLRGISRR